MKKIFYLVFFLLLFSPIYSQDFGGGSWNNIDPLKFMKTEKDYSYVCIDPPVNAKCTRTQEVDYEKPIYFLSKFQTDSGECWSDIYLYATSNSGVITEDNHYIREWNGYRLPYYGTVGPINQSETTWCWNWVAWEKPLPRGDYNFKMFIFDKSDPLSEPLIVNFYTEVVPSGMAKTIGYGILKMK